MTSTNTMMSPTPPRRPSGPDLTSDDEDYEEEEEEEELIWDGLHVDNNVKKNLWYLIARESRTVSLWAFLAPMLRLTVALLVQVAAYRDQQQDKSEAFSLWNEAYMTLSVLAGWVLAMLPKKATTGLAPGFFFASGWLLSFVKGLQGNLPNVPLRICEYVLGRMPLSELIVVLPVHFVCTLSTVTILRLLLPESLVSLAISPIVYSHDNPWLVDLMRETVANAAFTISILVIPELFALNKIPRWLATFVMYPLYGYAVDASGRGSTFGPNVAYALAAAAAQTPYGGTTEAVANFDILSFPRFLGPVLGSLLGGKIMTMYFPDNAPI